MGVGALDLRREVFLMQAWLKRDPGDQGRGVFGPEGKA